MVTANILHTFIGLTPHNFLKNKTKNNINNNVKKKKKTVPHNFRGAGRNRATQTDGQIVILPQLLEKLLTLVKG